MNTEKFPISPPSLEELAEKLKAPLEANFEQATVSVVQCPDLREAPFSIATEGLSGGEKIADIGGQSHLFPSPLLDKTYSMTQIAQEMELDSENGSLLGAGAGPFQIVGLNCELCPNIGWKEGSKGIENNTRYAMIDPKTGNPKVSKINSLDCALMANLYGSRGEPGPVLKITARKRIGPEKSFTECIRRALHALYGDSRTISLGGAFLVKSGTARYHIMPDFPGPSELPFKDSKQLNDWLTYHDFEGPIVCLSVLHSADPDKKMGLRMEHTHGYSPLGQDFGGHYHYDLEESNQEIEYEGYFNTAKMIYRIDRPTVTLERDLHD